MQLPTLCALGLLTLSSCGLKQRVELGDARDQVQAWERVSPTPEADTLLAQMEDLSKLRGAIAAYEAWYVAEHELEQVQDVDPDSLLELLMAQPIREGDRHVLGSLSKAWYFLGVSETRESKDSAEQYRRAISYGQAALHANPAIGTLLDQGVALEDTLVEADMEDLNALAWTATAWVRWGENRGALAVLRSLPLGVALYARVQELDPYFHAAIAHRGLGAVYCGLPKVLGGDRELGRSHLQRSLDLAPDYLETRVVYAEWYLLPMGDREGFVRMLQSVVDTEAGGDYPLDRSQAQEHARSLLAQIDRLF